MANFPSQSEGLDGFMFLAEDVDGIGDYFFPKIHNTKSRYIEARKTLLMALGICPIDTTAEIFNLQENNTITELLNADP